MTDTLIADNDQQSEGRLLSLLRDKHYSYVIHLIDRDYRERFRTEQSGESFEDCIDWCAQNAGGLENAKLVLLELFNKFYRQLPEPVRDNLAYLALEIGYSHSRPNFARLKERSIEKVGATKTAFNTMVKHVQDYVAELRRRREPQVMISFHTASTTPSVAPSMMMQRGEHEILEVQDQQGEGGNPCRAGGPESMPPKLRMSA